jgi:hypothetical protein
MRAVQIDRTAGVHVPSPRVLPEPVPDAGEVLTHVSGERRA